MSVRHSSLLRYLYADREKDNAFMAALVASVPSSTAQAAYGRVLFKRMAGSFLPLCFPLIYCIYLFIGSIRAKSLQTADRPALMWD